MQLKLGEFGVWVILSLLTSSSGLWWPFPVCPVPSSLQLQHWSWPWGNSLANWILDSLLFVPYPVPPLVCRCESSIASSWLVKTSKSIPSSAVWPAAMQPWALSWPCNPQSGYGTWKKVPRSCLRGVSWGLSLENEQAGKKHSGWLHSSDPKAQRPGVILSVSSNLIKGKLHFPWWKPLTRPSHVPRLDVLAWWRKEEKSYGASYLRPLLLGPCSREVCSMHSEHRPNWSLLQFNPTAA